MRSAGCQWKDERIVAHKTKRPRLRLESWDASLNSPPPELLTSNHITFGLRLEWPQGGEEIPRKCLRAKSRFQSWFSQLRLRRASNSAAESLTTGVPQGKMPKFIKPIH